MTQNADAARRARIEARLFTTMQDLDTPIELRPVPRFDPLREQFDFGAPPHVEQTIAEAR